MRGLWPRGSFPSHGKALGYARPVTRTLFEEAWGASKLVGDIGQSDVDRFTELRMSGAVTAEETLVVDGVRAGTVEADLRWVSTVFRWARGVKSTAGR